MRTSATYTVLLSLLIAPLALEALADDKPAECKEMRKINIGVAVSPPNVVHSTPFVARDLGFFAKRCIEVNIMEFEGGFSATAAVAIQQGAALGTLEEVAVGQGMKAHQVWGLAPRLPHSYVVTGDIKSVEDLKGKRLSASGGGVGSFNWRMGREMLKKAGLTLDDAQFIAQGTAGRLPGLISGQVDGVALHPEDVYLASQKRPDAHVLAALADVMPNQMMNAYGAADSLVQEDRQLVVDAIAAMLEANRTMYTDKDKVLPLIVAATSKDPKAVEFAWGDLTKNCVWSVNTGLEQSRSEWTIANSVANGDISPEKKPSFEQLVDMSVANDAVAQLGGPVEINGCKL